MANEKKHSKKLYNATIVAFVCLFTYMSGQDNLPRWVYFEHLMLLMCGVFPDTTSHLFYSLVSYPLPAAYVVFMYGKNWHKAYKSYKKDKKQ